MNRESCYNNQEMIREYVVGLMAPLNTSYTANVRSGVLELPIEHTVIARRLPSGAVLP